MARAIRIVFLLILFGLPLAVGIAAALPGPHRLLCPGCFGMREIADRVYVDPTSTRHDERRLARALIAARERLTAFYGELQGRPHVVACKTTRCLDLFGGDRNRAVAYGWHAIRMAPRGITAAIVTHELAHIELHWRMGLFGMLRPTIPVWFDEGLAVVLSGDRRFAKDLGDQAVEETMRLRTFSQWQAYTETAGWRLSYGSAATAVRRLHRQIGDDGLRKFLARVLAGENFDRLLSETMTSGIPRRRPG